MLLHSTGSSKGSYINSHYIIDNKEKAIKEANWQNWKKKKGKYALAKHDDKSGWFFNKF